MEDKIQALRWHSCKVCKHVEIGFCFLVVLDRGLGLDFSIVLLGSVYLSHNKNKNVRLSISGEAKNIFSGVKDIKWT